MTRAPWPARAAVEGWTPDDASAYCPRCATTVGAYEITEKDGSPVCQACADKRLPWTRAIRLGEYNGLLREAIHEVKFTRWRTLGGELGALLGGRLAESLRADGIDLSTVTLVPVPTTFRRRMQRGIDHTLVIARAAREVLGCNLVQALSRRHRPSQLDVPPSERHANVARAFCRRRGVALRARVVVLIDDVRTTGATMGAACRALSALPGDGPRTAGAQKPAWVAAGLWTAFLGVTPDPAKRVQKRAGRPERPSADLSGE
jgi:predicted amidophosphoribosyltransferase